MAEMCLIANRQSEINVSINIDDIDTDKDIDYIAAYIDSDIYTEMHFSVFI